MRIVCVHVRFEIVAALKELAALVAVTGRVGVSRVATLWPLVAAHGDAAVLGYRTPCARSLRWCERLHILFVFELGRKAAGAHSRLVDG